MRLFAVLIGVVAAAGCTGQYVDIGGGGGGGGADLAVGNDGDGAGGPLGFAKDVEPDIETKFSCTTGGCHQPTTASMLMLKAGDATNNLGNLKSLNELNTGSPGDSKLLTHLLPGASPTHTGGALLSGTGDPVYKKWLKWIQDGAQP